MVNLSLMFFIWYVSVLSKGGRPPRIHQNRCHIDGLSKVSKIWTELWRTNQKIYTDPTVDRQWAKYRSGHKNEIRINIT